MANTQTHVQIGWEDYLALAFRRKGFFLAPFCVVVLAGLLVAVFSPRIYSTYALIAVQNEKLINPLIQGLAMPTEVKERLNTLREEILSWSNLSQLVKAHDLDAEIPKGDAVAYDRLITRLRQDVKVKLDRGETLIGVSYSGQDPKTVQAVVNSLTKIVVERDEIIKDKESEDALGFIEAELEVYRDKLEGSERALRDFKELYMTQMPLATALNDQLKNLKLTLSRLLISNTEAHPRVIQVNRLIGEVQERRDTEVKRLVAKGVLKEQDPELHEQLLTQMASDEPAEGDLARARESYAALVEGFESPEVAPPTGSQVSVSSEGTVQVNDTAAITMTLSPRQQQELTRLTRDYEVNQTIYQDLLEKRERAKITRRLGDDEGGGKFTILEWARLPLKPVRPNLFHIFLITLIAACGLGVGAVVAAEHLDSSVQDAEEAEALLEVPVLASIPSIVTEGDLEERQRRRKDWVSVGTQFDRIKTRALNPLWARVDQALLRWGL